MRVDDASSIPSGARTIGSFGRSRLALPALDADIAAADETGGTVHTPSYMHDDAYTCQH